MSGRSGPADSPLRIRLGEERRARLLQELRRFYRDRFDEDLSAFRAEGLLDFFLGELGPAVYNQGVQDARKFVQEKLEDLEGEIYEPEQRG